MASTGGIAPGDACLSRASFGPRRGTPAMQGPGMQSTIRRTEGSGHGHILRPMKISIFLLALFLAVAPARAQALPDAIRFSIVVERGDLSLAREWLDAGLPPDFEGNVIGTGLMIGAWEGNIPMMELFLSRGADINKVNAHGEQALLHAAWKGRLEAVRWLVEHGARMNREGKQWAALHYAAFGGHAEVVAYLLERGADVNALSTNGSTALMMAAREGKESIAKTLLASGARTDIVNEWGDDAVRWAMRYNNLQIASEIAGREKFAVAAAKPAATWGRPVRSLPLPDRADLLLAQARKMEAAGRRDEALKLYRAALAAIREPGTGANKASTAARATTGMVITARRDKPGEQTATLNYATPAAGIDDHSKVGAGGTADIADDWLRRAREFEAAGRRKEALTAYRQAAAALRGGGQVPDISPIHP
ncbi:MAG: ankyrin repeat domain-containing protein [Betaproteobacteria bacterium]|nr:ankyrin repeat domain-containing protein [Betaproteobacteria bacterium]